MVANMSEEDEEAPAAEAEASFVDADDEKTGREMLKLCFKKLVKRAVTEELSNVISAGEVAKAGIERMGPAGRSPETTSELKRVNRAKSLVSWVYIV